MSHELTSAGKACQALFGGRARLELCTDIDITAWGTRGDAAMEGW